MQKDKNSQYNGFITKKGNFIWSGALTLAWNQLTRKIIKEPVKLDTDDQDVVKIAQNFNHSKFSFKDINENSIYIKSGFGQETVTTINTQKRQKFPQKSFSDLNIKLGHNDLIAYAYLFKNLQFRTPFKRSQGKFFEFEGQKVDSFYAQNMDQKEQINYAYYDSSDKFMVSINGKKPTDIIYFIKNKSIRDCDHAIKEVETYEQKGKNQLKEIDVFQMPVVDFDLCRELRELVGKSLKNKNISGFSFQYVVEAIKLKIDQSGAKVQNEAIMGMLGSGFSKNQPEPKYFILDKEFWIVMKQVGRHPYLCALVKDPINLE